MAAAAHNAVFMLFLISGVRLSVAAHTTVPPHFTVNLDLPEEERWNGVIAKYGDYIKQAAKEIINQVPVEAMPLVEMIAADIDKYLPSPYAGEMRGIAKSANMNLGDVVIVNIIYDVTAFCTSIGAQDTNGTIWHARNLDYRYRFTDMLRNVTISVDFQRRGQTVYSSVTYAAYIGILTGQKPHKFTVTVDERDRGAWWMNALMAILYSKAKPMSFLVRDVLESSENFDDAVDTLSNTLTDASEYFIVAGTKPGEGAIITKGRLAPLDIWKLNLTAGRWFEVETNYDHWVEPPAHDDRRHPAINAMEKLGQNQIDKMHLFNDVMSLHPVLNNRTVYTVVMSAANPDFIQSWVQHPDP
ncbi:hypothetical protein ScPMuIL_006441 [Solemya velum]